MLFIMVIGFFAGIYPACKASKINPVEAIKG
jgi:ABC-type antimicrobial peptide transport system permease subunit